MYMLILYGWIMVLFWGDQLRSLYDKIITYKSYFEDEFGTARPAHRKSNFPIVLKLTERLCQTCLAYLTVL